jgi:VDE lipocalin domain
VPDLFYSNVSGRTLQGSYEGAFVYAKEPILPQAALPSVRAAAQKAGWDFDKDFTRIDNSCPAGSAATAGSSSSSNLWQLVVGEGGIIDWISPGWRGEYDRK